ARRFAEAGKPWRWRPVTELVERLRAAKDEGEVAAIRAAALLAGEALRRTLAQVRPGMTELAIAGLLEGALRQLGSEGHPFPTIVASGPRSALPHARSSGRIVATGEWLLLDFGAQVDGYCADITRTVVAVEPGVYLAGEGGVRIEDDVHLPPDGAAAELLSDGLTDLVEVVSLGTVSCATGRHEPRHHRPAGADPEGCTRARSDRSPPGFVRVLVDGAADQGRA